MGLTDWEGGHYYRFTHDMFRFPGKFHPPLIEHILKKLEPEAVVDPMGGVGTVAVEAKAAGIPSLSVDIDPLSTFFTRVKSTPLDESVLLNAWTQLRENLDRHRRPSTEVEKRKIKDISERTMKNHLNRLDAGELAGLIYWFRRYVLVDYSRVNYAINNGGLPGQIEKVRNFFLACLLSSVRRISNADPSPVSGLEITKHMRKKFEKGYEIDVFKEFYRRVEFGIDAMVEYQDYLHEKGVEGTRTCISTQNCYRLTSILSAYNFDTDLILFSPPYCNAIEYWRRHRLEYLLGGFLDYDKVSTFSHNFIGRTVTGGRAKKPRKIGYPPVDDVIEKVSQKGRVHKAAVLKQYFEDMERALLVFFKALPKTGHCVIVVGDSTTHGKQVPTTDTLTWLGKQAGFNHILTETYKIRNRSMQFPIKPHNKIQEESIIVLRRDD